MKSQFKIVSYFIPLFFLLLIGFIAFNLTNIGDGFNSVFGAYLVYILLIIATILCFFEIRNKIIYFKFNLDSISISRFFGFGKTISFKNSEIEGFKTSIVKTNFGNYNYIYLIQSNKKIAKISNQYHNNFNDLLLEIKSRYKDLGSINSGFVSEIKDIINLEIK